MGGISGRTSARRNISHRPDSDEDTDVRAVAKAADSAVPRIDSSAAIATTAQPSHTQDRNINRPGNA